MSLSRLILFFIAIALSMTVVADTCGRHIQKESKVDSLRVAAVQYELSRPTSVQAWKAKLESYLKRAADGHAQVVLLPELLSIEGMALSDPDGHSPKEAIRKVASDLTPLFRSFFCELSKRYAVTIIAGTWPEMDRGKVYNVARVYSDGEVIHEQKKNHLTSGEITDYELTGGTGNATAFQLPGGIDAAIAICFDSEFPTYLPATTGVIPEVIFVPSMTSDDSGRYRVARSASARAVEFHAYVVVTGTTGGSETDPIFGTNVAQAKIFEPSDKLFPTDGVTASGTLNHDEIVFADLDLKRLRKSREISTVFPAKILHEAASSQRQTP